MEKKIKNFYFQKFSTIPDGLYKKEEGVLVGIKTPNESLYKQLPQFIEIKVRSSCKSIVKHNNITPIHTNQTLATHTGVYYKLKSMPDTILLATTSDDRSIDLIAPHAEEFVPQHIEGAYNGVRDIEFIDDTHFVCAQYDGSLILFSLIKKNNKKSSWRLTNVIKSHHGWVWKAGLYDEWSDENQRVVSCSYDGTVRITDFSNSETSVPIIKASQPIRGVYRKGSDIWAFSPQSMYHARFAEDKWISDDAYDENDFGISQLNISLIADLDNDVPFVFYNTGKGTQGYIAAFENHSKLINKITCEEGVFLRKIKQYFYKENDYMVVVGSKDKMAYVALYQRADSNYLPEPVSSCSMSSSTPNDFTIVNSKWGDYIIIVNSNNSITTCRINADLSLTEDKLLTNLTGQPLCITSNGDLILVGLLNGKILQVVMTDNSENSFNFSYKDFAFTHANLYSTPNVDLSECEIQDEESFKAQLKDYFSFD
ncbi:WD40 repeat domain-containing protein [Ruminococcus bicirculans]|uniref:WD40 repeat domain-containing protein n=1 Tax=Ruminococcus bicirculans (ex Wegman et al. 2014) TaxID=1160721 RepID=A0AAW6ECL4_9FIRM|nr:WD40 repeat domain-containing protein [Ruminococcus bicirculans (ex Wegman et al. 2014)]MDB8750481.1 WD40 repeat domain-containing protein [Ruminococcus bicirculans (ex Wegman et al. 2014)]